LDLVGAQFDCADVIAMTPTFDNARAVTISSISRRPQRQAMCRARHIGFCDLSRRRTHPHFHHEFCNLPGTAP
jgi:hypothetical protein